jgi:hypothetical protein
MEEHPHAEQQMQTTAGQGFGIAGMILGVLALVIAFIPCVGLIAIVPGAIAIILSIIGLIQANQGNGAKGLIIAALVISILATSIAAIWGIVIGGLSKDSHQWKDRIERFVESNDKESWKELETSLKALGAELEKTFGDADGFDPDTYEFGDEITDEEFNKVLGEYEKMVDEFAGLVRQANKDEISSVIIYSAVSLKAASLAATLMRIGPKLTEEQKERFEAVNKKYEKVLDEVD